MRVKEEREIASLKQHSKMKIMASGCITSQQRDGGKVEISSVQSLSHVWLFATPWTAVRQAFLSITNSWSLCKLMSIESVMPSKHLIFFRPFSSCLQSFPASGSFPVRQIFASGGQSIGVSPSVEELPMNTKDWYPLGRTGWISLQSKWLKSLLQHHSSKASISSWSAFFTVQLSHPYTTTGKTIALTRQTFVGKVLSLRFLICCLGWS